MSVLNLPATEQLDRLRAGEFSSTELVRATLAEIDRRNGDLNALVTLRADAAMSEAELADRAIGRGEPRRLEGVPFSVKDLIATAGVRTTAGSRLLQDHVPDWSAPAIKRLQAEGAILIGKANCSEFGIGNLHTGNRVFGDTRNPRASDRTPGGSSGGDSAAVAAGLASFGVGTDYGGSVRWPAHCTGITALRPTPGRIPNTGVLPHSGIGQRKAVNSSSFQCWIQTIGPLARSAHDLALLVDVMSGPDANDAHTLACSAVSPCEFDVRELACAWLDSAAALPVRADIAGAVADAATALRDRGVRVEAISPPGFERAITVYEHQRAADGLRDHLAVAGDRFDELTPLVRQELTRAAQSTVTLSQYRSLADEADALRAQIAAFMCEWPILLLPVGSVPAFLPGEREFEAAAPAEPRSMFEACCRAISLLRVPAAVVPCGTSDEGLPIGVQVVGRRFHDADVLAVACALEAEFGTWRPRPKGVSA
jgi:Asp-tRNA(Asn)/Glu-tRNA(Gln) amidotransferase A subunit family amidase